MLLQDAQNLQALAVGTLAAGHGRPGDHRHPRLQLPGRRAARRGRPLWLSRSSRSADLKTYFPQDEGVVRAVDGASFALQPGRTLGIVGESGCGKSVTARSILRIVERPGRIEGGEIWLRRADGERVDLAKLDPQGPEMREIRGGEIGLVFQEPMTSFSAYHTVGNQMIEAIRLHSDLSKKQARERAIEMLRMVGIPRPERRIDEYAFELSGGLRQRVMIAMALSAEPRILIADEPTTALDVTTQAQILELVRRLQAEQGLAVILITHDMGVIAEMADDVVVMYLGREVESGPVDEIFHSPQHPYTRSLLRSIPSIMAEPRSRLPTIDRLDPASLQPAQGLPLPSALPRLHARDLRRRAFPGRRRRSARRTRSAASSIPAETIAPSVGMSAWAPPSSRSSTCRNGSRSAAACCAAWSAMCARSTMSASTSPGARRSRWSANWAAARPRPRAASCARSRPPPGAIRFRTRTAARVDVAQAAEDGAAAAAPADADDLPGPVLVAEPAHDDHGHHRRAAARQRHARSGRRGAPGCASCCELVQLPAAYLNRFPHAFSGGQRQRIGIARALALNPALIVADEPVSALDVSVQAQIVNLLLDLQDRLGLSYLFVAHDLSVVKHVSDRVAVMYVGKIVEIAPTARCSPRPRHPYTEALLSAVPVPDPRVRSQRIVLEGEVADPANAPPGCPFHPRCAYVVERCRNEAPALRELAGGHAVRCHRAEELTLAGVPDAELPAQRSTA